MRVALSEMRMKGAKAVFLDLNGTLVMPISAQSLEDLVELRGVRDAVGRLIEAGFVCPVITVQSRIAKGIYSQAQFGEWFETFRSRWLSDGIPLLGPYVCPHRFHSGCRCAKPQPELYLRACQELRLDPSRCFVIGDSATDVFAARNIGARGCLVLTGNGLKGREACQQDAFVVGRDLADVVARLLERADAMQ